ncbi:hypothetical protein KC19_VG318000 [Ceratodon purpureus]|uniref:Uncharacterized protein n=1 Tax=Ceratodon purpureus TaxID=3225 RepID=A0A8T0HW71_CERPU|nr:hypothetical protein KC19_VG318000 [Ceratodon purpureus]
MMQSFKSVATSRQVFSAMEMETGIQSTVEANGEPNRDTTERNGHADMDDGRNEGQLDFNNNSEEVAPVCNYVVTYVGLPPVRGSRRATTGEDMTAPIVLASAMAQNGMRGFESVVAGDEIKAEENTENIVSSGEEIVVADCNPGSEPNMDDESGVENVVQISHTTPPSSEVLCQCGNCAREVIILSDDEDDNPLYKNPRKIRGVEGLGVQKTKHGDNVNDPNYVDSERIRMYLENITKTLTWRGIRKYSPLQKWEYKKGHAVDGVKEVEKWAIDVGLAIEEGGSSNPSKKRRLSNIEEPVKYGQSSTSLLLPKDEDTKKESEDRNKLPNNEDDVDSDIKRKGKKPMDNQ